MNVHTVLHYENLLGFKIPWDRIPMRDAGQSIWIYKIQCGLPLSLAQALSGPTFLHVAQHNPQSKDSPLSTRLAIVGFVILNRTS